MSLDPMTIAALRAKCADGTVTKDELREAYAVMRQARTTIPIAKGGSRTNAASRVKKPVDSDDLLSQLDGL